VIGQNINLEIAVSMSSSQAITSQNVATTPKLPVKSPITNTPTSRSKSNKGNKTSRHTNSEDSDKGSSNSVMSNIEMLWERARTEEHRHKQQDSVSIVITTGNTAHERMRKISGLTLDDEDLKGQPNRYPNMQIHDTEEKHTSNTAYTEQKEEAMFTRWYRPNPGDGNGTPEQEPHSADIEPKDSEKSGAVKGKTARATKVSSPWTKPSGFAFPAALGLEESDFHHRQQSMHPNECLVEVEKVNLSSNLSKQCKAERQSLDGVQDDSSEESQQVVQITRRGMEVRGFVATTTKQRQLMRMVSGLGMEDPVFGNIAGQLRPKHASNIYDDMDLDDVPEDMRDMLTLVSDRTDVVDLDDDIIDSPATSKGNESERTANFARSCRALSNLHTSCSSLRPLGLDPSAMMLSDICSPRRIPMKKCGSCKAPHLSSQGGNAESTMNTKKSHYESPLPSSYTPPAGSFIRKKTSRKPSVFQKAIVKMPDDGPNVDTLYQKFASTVEFSSNGLDVAQSPALRSKSPRRYRRRSMGDGSGNYQVSSPSNCRDRGLSTSSVFVPPEMQSVGQRTSQLRHSEERRALPSMGALFPDVAGTTSALNVLTTTASVRREEQRKSPTGRPKISASYGLQPCFSPFKLNGQSTSASSRLLPPPAAYSSVRKPAAAYSIKAKRRDTASTTDMSPSSSFGTVGKWSYPENPTRFCS
jgi:hypothetical protein